MAASNTTKYKHPLYNIWRTLKRRCLRQSDSILYPHYGGRGIKLYQPWADDFQRFVADMGERPSKRHSIERINNEGHYEPGNVRWATWREQSENRRNSRYVVWRGEKYLVSQLARKIANECELDTSKFDSALRYHIMKRDKERNG